MDDVGPLRQLAALVSGPATSAQGGQAVGITGVSDSRGRPALGAGISFGPRPAGQVSDQAMTLSLSRPTLLQPTDVIRYRRAGGGRGGDGPQYPPVAAAIDYMLPEGFSGPLTIEITDTTGRVVRTVQASAGRGGGRGQGGGRAGAGGQAAGADMRFMGGRGRGAGAGATMRPGHNRYLWNFQWDAGVWAAPGRFTVKMTAGDVVESRTFEVKADPGVLADGIIRADLVEQQNFLLRVREAIDDGRQLQQRLQKAMQEAGVPMPPSPGPGEWVGGMKYEHPLQSLWARLVTAPGTYEQGMLIDQLSNIARAEGGADQKIGAEARKRFDDLLKELKMLQAELETIAGVRS
jgi:hypothetical protein